MTKRALIGCFLLASCGTPPPNSNQDLAEPTVLKANGGGALVQLNSVASYLSFPDFATYAASKAAAYEVRQLTVHPTFGPDRDPADIDARRLLHAPSLFVFAEVRLPDPTARNRGIEVDRTIDHD